MSLAAAWGDYDNDGFPDAFVAFGGIFSPQRNGLYRNNGNSNSWIKIRCVGTVSNRSAIGTKVRVLAVLPRDGGVMRVDPLDLRRRQPLLHDLRNELQLVVTVQSPRCPMLLEGEALPFQDVPGFQCPVRPQHVTFPRLSNHVMGRLSLSGSQ